MLKTLAIIQLPLVALLVVLPDAVRHPPAGAAPVHVLRGNIDSLSAGDADLTRRIVPKGEDEMDAVGEPGQPLHCLPAEHDRRRDPGPRR